MKNLPVLPGQPRSSPSGKYLLEVIEIKIEKYIYWSFRILKVEKAVVFQCREKFDIRHSTIIMWDDNDRVWVYSGDLGVFIWEAQNEDSEWAKIEYSQSNLKPPDFLIKEKPRLFTK
jgi:hypothetical protein